METNEKVYASQQLICMLPALALKVLLYLMNWQRYGNVKYFQKQMCGFLHIDASELDLAIQTLADNKLIDVCKIDDNWCFNLNKDTIKKYFDVPMQTIKDHEGLKLSKEITWNKETTTQSNDVNDMSEDEMKRMLLMLQARLKEKQEVKKVVVTNDVVDDLPW
jgi:hypothetical protein